MPTESFEEKLLTAVRPVINEVVARCMRRPPTKKTTFRRVFNPRGWSGGEVQCADWPGTAFEVFPTLERQLVADAVEQLVSMSEIDFLLKQYGAEEPRGRIHETHVVRALAMEAVRDGLAASDARLVKLCQWAGENLSKRTIRRRYTLLMQGIEVRCAEPIALDATLALHPLSDSQIDDFVGRWRNLSGLPMFIGHGALVLETSHPLGDRGDEEAWNRLESVLGLIQLHANCAVRPLALEIQTLSPFSIFGTSSCATYPLEDFGEAVVDEAGANWLKSAWKTLDSEPLRDHHAFSRFSSAARSTVAADALIDLWIALESLLAGAQASELSYRMRLRVPLFVSKSRIERRELSKLVKSSYELRSKLVHGSRHHEALKDSDKEVVRRTQELARRVLLEVLREGIPDVETFEEELFALGAVE